MSDIAEKCFVENLRLFGNAQTQPEKFNLYNGLANLASTIISMQYQLQTITNELRSIRHQMGR